MCQTTSTVPDLHETLTLGVNQSSPTVSRVSSHLVTYTADLFNCSSLQDLGDEIDCDVPTCGEWLKNFYGSFSSPNYPDFYPPGSNCTWLIDTGDHRKVTSDLRSQHKQKRWQRLRGESQSPPSPHSFPFLQVILRFTDFKLDGTGYGDYVKVYDGLEENPRRLLRVLTAFDSRAPVTVVSSSGQLRVHFYADKINAARGFNVTYQVCLT